MIKRRKKSSKRMAKPKPKALPKSCPANPPSPTFPVQLGARRVRLSRGEAEHALALLD